MDKVELIGSTINNVGHNMFKIIWVLSILLGFSVPGLAQDRSLVLIQDSIINVYYKGKYKELFRLEPSSSFYGYGWIGDGQIFVAYQHSELSEAVADLKLFDLKKDTTLIINSFGGVGESNFVSYPSKREIVYNDSNGIFILTVNEDLSYRIDMVIEDSDTWGVFWVNADTIGYIQSNDHFVTIPAIKKPYWTTRRFQNLDDASLNELRWLRYEIYARHGHVFDDKVLRSIFRAKPWYREHPEYNVSPDSLFFEEQQLLQRIMEREHLLSQ